MKNSIYSKLLDKINDNYDVFNKLVLVDNKSGLNVTINEIESFLEFSKSTNLLRAPIVGNVLITEGDIYTIMMIINELSNYNGKYLIFINNDNIGTNTYLIKMANEIYQNNGINVNITIDYNENYNDYLNTLVTIIGSKQFIKETQNDFKQKNLIII